METPDESFIKILVEDTNELISKLAVDVSAVGPYSYGSPRYRTVSLAYDQLGYARNQSGPRWEAAMTNNRRNGDYLMEELWKIKLQLQDMGEGPARPNS